VRADHVRSGDDKESIPMQHRFHRATLTFATLAGVLAATASIGRADFTICNQSSDVVYVDYKVPADWCDSGFEGDHVGLAQGACKVLFTGSVKGKTTYYYALTQTGDREWIGDSGVWLPDNTVDDGKPDGRLCLPSISCRPSEGNVCGDGRVYSMRGKTSTTSERKVTLVD
jgi:uncharacterized membrane protein